MKAFLTSYFCKNESSSLIWFVRLREVEMDNIEEMWQQFQLTEEEDSEINVDEECLAAETKKGEQSLVGKLCSDRIISKEVVLLTMAKIWKTGQPFYFQDISPNLFVISFETQED